jgi:hypothetical protein
MSAESAAAAAGRDPIEVPVPAGSRAASLLPGADFFDAWRIDAPATDSPALGYFIAAAQKTPRWVDICMDLRNRAGSLVGLKHLGTLSDTAGGRSAADYRPGERVGIFTVFENGFDEALIGDDDKHLKVVLSIHRGPVQADGRLAVTVSTIVHVKNLLGKVYMLPVAPMHRLIAPAVLARIADSSPTVATADG